MKCNYCSTEFISTNNRGAEQKYCSTKCRSNAANKRREQRLMMNNTNISNNINETKNIPLQYPKGDSESNYRVQRDETRINNGFGNITDNHLAVIKELYEAKNETNFYKLKCESLEKEIIELKLELEEIDNEEDDKYSGMLGGVMEQFKQDPVNTISFASELINNLFKPKP